MDINGIGDQILLFFAAFASIAAAILAGFNLYDRFKAAKKPHDQHVEMVLRHEEKLTNDWNVLLKIQEENRLLLENDMLVIEHIINGDHVDRLKDQHIKLQRHLIEK